jgi:hypothetical protein
MIVMSIRYDCQPTMNWITRKRKLNNAHSVLDVNNIKTMSSSQQEFLFFDTIAHDGEIDQVIQKQIEYEI